MMKKLSFVVSLVFVVLTITACGTGVSEQEFDRVAAELAEAQAQIARQQTAVEKLSEAPQGPKGDPGDRGVFTGIYNVVDFGAAGDGVRDDTRAFQAAIDAAETNGGMVLVPSVGGGRGYVLTGTVHVRSGVALIGSLAGWANNGWAAYSLPESHVKGAKIFARPTQLGKPLFQMEGGSTVRGFWILYDEQPMPSDEEFQNPNSRFHYPSYEVAKSNFIRDHVKAYGPTFYVTFGDNTVVEDILADRYYDFYFLKQGAKARINRISLYGYNRAFVIEESFDVNRISDVEIVPNVGPTCPCKVDYLGKSWTWIYDIIVSQQSNVGIHLGISDGYILDNLSFFGVHTAIRLGASTDFPIYDPVADTTWTNPPATGPWGQMSNIQIDQAAVGLHFVWPSTLGNRISNAHVFPSFDDGGDFPATTGTGSLTNVGREAAFLFESTFAKSNNFSFIPTILASNVTIDSFKDTARFPRAAARLWDANGRVFLIAGDVTMEITGFSLSFGNEDVMVATAPTAGDVSIRIRGYVRGGNPGIDKRIDKTGVRALE